jgi:hypothetical protein
MTSLSRQSVGRHNLTEPLRIPVFRRIWLASLMSNLGMMIVSVGAAWSMTDMTRSAAWVGLVQSALQNLSRIMTLVPR